MIVEKIIQTVVHLTDPALLYSNNMDAVILDNLKQRFEGYCYRSCLILEVLEIQERGYFIFSRQRQDASASCCVRFKVKGIVIKKHEMLHNCVVNKVHKDGHIICRNKHAAIIIKASESLQTIKEGQTIVVFASGAVKYKISKPVISVNAIPFVPIFRDTVVFNIKLQSTPLIKKLITDMKREIETNETIDSSVHSFFNDLIYPYKSKKKLTNILKIGSIISLEKVSEMKEGTNIFISQPDCLSKDTPAAILFKSPETKNILGTEDIQRTGDGISVKESCETVLGYMIYLHIEHLISIRNLCATYNTMDEITKNNNLWDIYKKHRRD